MSYERLWAPWRLAYIQGAEAEKPAEPLPLLPGADAECFLCQAAVDPDMHRRQVVHRASRWLAVLNRYPYMAARPMSPSTSPISNASSVGVNRLFPPLLCSRSGRPERHHRFTPFAG